MPWTREGNHEERKRRGRRRNAEGRAKPGHDARIPPSLPCVRTCSEGSSYGRDDDRFQSVIRLPPVASWRKSVIPHQNQPVGFQSENRCERCVNKAFFLVANCFFKILIFCRREALSWK
jgi:hypothetical protein